METDRNHFQEMLWTMFLTHSITIISWVWQNLIIPLSLLLALEIQMKAERCEVWWWRATQHTFNSHLSLIMMKIQIRKKQHCWRRSSLMSHFRLNVQYLLGNCLTYTRICLCRSRCGPQLWYDWEMWVKLCAHLMLRMWIHTYIFVGVVFFFKAYLYIMFGCMYVPHMNACCLPEAKIKKPPFLWNWSHSQLWLTMWVLENTPGSSARKASAHLLSDFISPALWFSFSHKQTLNYLII